MENGKTKLSIQQHCDVAVLKHRQEAHEIFQDKIGRVFQDEAKAKDALHFANEEACALPPNLTIEACEILQYVSALTLPDESESEAKEGEEEKGEAVNVDDKQDEEEKEAEVEVEKEEEVEEIERESEDEIKYRASPSEPLRILSFDWNICQNIMEHNTEMYNMAQTACKTSNDIARLVVRRGQPFVIQITFDRKYDFEYDDVTLIFQTGSSPQPSDRTSFPVRVSDGLRKYGWSVGVHLSDDNKVHFKVMIPVSSIIGKFHVDIETKLKIIQGLDESGENTPEKRVQWKVLRFKNEQPMYIICNPFCKEDQVYMADEVMRDECILNDFGHIFVGNQFDILLRPWKYAQFAEPVLDCCFTLLDLAKLRHSSRGSAVDIVRAISNLVNSSDDSGLMRSSWSGKYDDGTAPTLWLSSLQIIEEFKRTELPVKYGQCSVFAACAVTLCRSLGIPARCVTAYSAAHDCDGSNSVNTHWDFNGKPIVKMNHDYLWSFHVWAEAYMSRPDIPGPYSGWQAFDPTPQVSGKGIVCTGPCPVKAIKEADVHMRDGIMLMFSDLNACRYHWIMEGDGSYRNTVDRKASGRRIVTEYSRLYQDDERNSGVVFSNGLNLLREYKQAEGTEEESIALKRAHTWATHGGVYEDGQGDVEITFNMRKGTQAGSTFDVQLGLQNRCRYERNVDVTLTLTSVQNTGVIKRRIRSQMSTVKLCPLEGSKAVLRVMGEDYSLVMTDNLCFMIDAVAKVRETDQIFAGCREHQLIPPRLSFTVPAMILEGDEFVCQIRFENSLPVTLVNCQFQIDALGLFHEARIPHSDIEPFEIVEIKVPMTPRVSGKIQIIASLHSRELSGVYGELEINI